MHQRQHKFLPDSIGSRVCEKTLGKILLDLKNPKITNAATSRYFLFKNQLIQFVPLFKHSNKHFALKVIELWKKDMFEKWTNTYDLGYIPSEVYTFLLCCMTAEYKDFIKEQENVS